MTNRLSIPIVSGLRVIHPGSGPQRPGPIESRLRGDGWRFGVPPNLTEDAARADADACTEMHCPECNKQGMLWRPYTKVNAYRAVAACIGCGYQEEI